MTTKGPSTSYTLIKTRNEVDNIMKQIGGLKLQRCAHRKSNKSIFRNLISYHKSPLIKLIVKFH